VALLAKNKATAKRKATIIALTETILIVLDKESYMSCLENSSLNKNKKSN
jgi:hypothetical protein